MKEARETKYEYAEILDRIEGIDMPFHATRDNTIKHLKEIGIILTYGIGVYPISMSYPNTELKDKYIDLVKTITFEEWQNANNS